MRFLIAYASKSKTTEKCAMLLAEKLGGAQLFDLQKAIPDTTAYDVIVIGGSVRYGHLHHAASRYIAQNSDLLSEHKCAFFCCCGFDARAAEYLKNSIPQPLFDSAVAVSGFGGDMDIEKQTGLDKFVLKMVLKVKSKDPLQSTMTVSDERIEDFAKQLLSL
ncbi:MAG: flavodoxin domain-containing protein [Oscillospiraceae bacterium]